MDLGSVAFGNALITASEVVLILSPIRKNSCCRAQDQEKIYLYNMSGFKREGGPENFQA